MPLEGQYLGHYRLLRLLGSGGMGEVYLAEDARIDQQVAIKVIRAEGIAYPQSESAKEAARLFEREAKAIARLDHPHILPLYAYGEEALHDSVLTYLVMPYRKEGTLASWLRQRGSATALSPAEVAPLLQQAAEALQHAHHQQVLHQDIKPSNFLIRLHEDHHDQPDLLLADFGIAKLTSATGSLSQSIRGTPTYMAPEQWDGHPVAATDQYALAIMIYELLVGRPPFVGNPGQVMRQHYLVPPPPPSTLNPRLSAAIDAVLLRALSKQHDERFATVAAFARAFQEAMHSDGELHATLALSQGEAESGTTRTLTLPGGRQVSVTVPAGVGAGTTLRLEGQGMPYYEGGPAGPLVLTIALPAEVSPLSLPQDSTDPTVTASMPNAELPSIEDPRVPPARLETPGDLEPPLLALDASESAPTVFATNATLLAPPPPSSQRRGKRIGLIVGVVLLVLLLIGGGVFAWLEYTAASNAATAAAVATATAQAHATATASAQARSQPFPAKGTATGVSSTTTKVVQDGSNKISSITEQWVASGDIMGSFTVKETSILHPDKTATSSGSSTCTCTVAGKSGTLMWSFTDTGTADGSYQGQFFDFHGTGDLAKLHGQGTFQGQGSHATYSTELYFGA